MRELEKSIKTIARSLNLPVNDWDQDWDIVVWTGDRLSEFLEYYHENHNRLVSDDLRLLIALIFAAIDDSLSAGEDEDDLMVDFLTHISDNYINVISDIVQYWSQWEDDNKFAIYYALKKHIIR